MMNIEQVNQFCDQWLPLWTQGDPASLLQFYTEDAYYQDPDTPDGIKGHDALLTHFTNLLPIMSTWKLERVEIFLTYKGFFVRWKATIPVDNNEITRYGVDLIELENNLIIRNEVYVDRFIQSHR